VRISVINDSDGGLTHVITGIPYAQYPAGYGFAVYYQNAPPHLLATIEIQEWDPIPLDAGPTYPYRGTIEASAADGTHYSIGVGVPVMRTPAGGTSAPLVFPADAANVGPPSSDTRAVAQELYSAMMTQFRTDLSAESDCFATGDCFVSVNVGTFSTETVFGFVPLHLYLGVRVLAGTSPWLPANTVDMIDLTVASPSG
jgi:hypothetical protein